MMKFNKEQQMAIDARGCSILVSAPAGSGKTRILVARIVDLLINGMTIDQLLVLTFTEAAANEMKQRLSTSIQDILKEDTLSPEISQHLSEQLLKLPNAAITTFHSFCHLLLEHYGYLVNVMPGFQINDKPRYIQQLILDECLKTWVKEEDFIDFFHRHCERYTMEDITNMILQYHDVSTGYVNFFSFIDEWCQYDPLSSDDYLTRLKSIFTEEAQKALSRLNSLASFAKDNGLSAFFEGNDKKVSSFDALNDFYTELIDRLPLSIDVDDVYALIKQKPGKSTNMVWKGIDEDIKKEFNSRKNKVNKPFTDRVKALVPVSRESFSTILQWSYEDIMYLLGSNGLLDRFQKAYQQVKQTRNELDFSDLERKATSLLSDDLPIRAILHHTFKEIMIDEYQDTNQVQENMMQMIAHYDDDNDIPLFMVGDMKQSIYRFRQADPTIFKEKYRHFSTSPEDIEKTKTQRIDLHYNYRSHKRVLDSINYIFNQIMDERIGGLEYYRDQSAWLFDDVNVHHKTIEMLDAEPNHDTELLLHLNNTQETDYSKNEIEAHMVAQHIQQLVQTTDFSYHNIAVLMATSKEFVNYKKIFNRYHIPANIMLSEGLLDTIEVTALIKLLEALIDPYDNIAMLTVLRSPFLFTHFNENEMLALRNSYTSIYENMKASSDAHVMDALETFEQLRQLISNHSPYDILLACLKATDYQTYVGTLLNGEQRSANIDMLIELFRTNDLYPYLGDYLEVFKASGSPAPGMIVSEDNDAVTFMTIHKSKGLEFDVVYVSNLDHQFNTQDESGKILLDPHLGVAMRPRRQVSVDHYDDIICQYDNQYRSLMSIAIKKESHNEQMRLLYVALTRASKKLVLTGSINDLDKVKKLYQDTYLNESDSSVKKSESLIYNVNLRDTNNFLDWIIMATARHPDMASLHRQLELHGHYAPHVLEQAITPVTQLAQFKWALHDNQSIIAKIPDYKNQAGMNRYNEVASFYNYHYPYNDTTRSIAVTKLQALEDEENGVFLNVEGPGREHALALGTLVHELLSHFTFTNDHPIELLNQLHLEGLFNDEEKTILMSYMPHIEAFVESDLYQQISRACDVFKEKPFRYKDHNGMVINGIFDLVYFADGQLFVLDYKTDHIKGHQDLKQLQDKHRLQLDYYCQVLKTYYHQDVTGIVYYLETNQAVII